MTKNPTIETEFIGQNVKKKLIWWEVYFWLYLSDQTQSIAETAASLNSSLMIKPVFFIILQPAINGRL